MVGRPSRRFKSGRETLPKVRKWLGDTPEGPEVVGRPSQRPEVVGDPPGRVELVWRPSWRSGTGLETLPKVRKWSGDPTGSVELVGRPFCRSGTGRETLPETGSGRRPSWMCETGLETLLVVRNWTRDPPGSPELVGRPSRRFGSGRESLTEVRILSGDTP